MSPLPDELRTALHSRADTIGAPPDPFDAVEAHARRLRHRRRGTYAASGAAATALAVVIGVVLGNGGDDATLRPQPPLSSSQPTPSAEPSPKPINLLQWDGRWEAGDVEDPDIAAAVQSTLDDATSAWAREYTSQGTTYVGTRLLFSDVLPDGRRVVVFQAWSFDGGGQQPTDAWTVYYAAKQGVDATTTAAQATMVTTPTWYRDPTPGAPQSALKYETDRIPELSAGLPGPDATYAIVIAKDPMGTVRYAADGVHYVDETTKTGVAVFALEGNSAAPTIEVRDGAGELTYRGPIDTMGAAGRAAASPAG